MSTTSSQSHNRFCKLTLVCCMIAAFAPAVVNAQNFAWADRFGGTGIDQAYSMAMDASGNVYTTGLFQSTVDFDPGVGVFNLTAAGTYDIFISKLDASGNFIWAKKMGGSSSDVGNFIAVDASGDVYITGYFVSTADFDPGAGTFNLTSAGLTDGFVTKLDASGNFIWAKRIGGTSDESGKIITFDASGNVYTGGKFRGTVDFDPDAGTNNLSSVGSDDVFVTKWDASGNFIWARAWGGSPADFISGMAVDASGNVFTTGAFQGAADFDPGAGTFNLSPAGINDAYISKLDASGSFVWAKRIGGTGADGGTCLLADASGDINIGGSFSGTVDFDPGAGIFNLSSGADVDAFLCKLDASGNFIQAISIGGSGADAYTYLAKDASGDFYATGYFQNTVDFDPGVGTFNLTAAGDYDIFVSKQDASGNLIWAVSMGGANLDYAVSMAVDPTGNVFTAGYFTGTSDFDPGAGTFNLSSVGIGDAFVSKLSPPPVLPIELLYFTGHAEPAANILEWATATEKNSAWQIVERSPDGADDWSETGRIAGAGNSTDPISYKITDENPLPLGYYRLLSQDFDGSVEYSGIVSIQRQSADLSILNVFPVPADKEVSLVVNVPTSGDVVLSVHNALGHLVYLQKFTLGKGRNEVKVDFERMPAGNYSITIADDFSRVVQQVVKM
jgi:hypothetical protein